jgi:gamma-glutamylcyclotransferase (GGCT)/AIG2-like uncharacterized protein YtfP
LASVVPSEPPVRLFVYGSLKRGFVHHAELRGAAFEGEAETAEGYCLYVHAGYPALVFEAGVGRVSGEVFSVSPSLLPLLDAFEDCPRVYQRESIALQDGARAQAYVMTPASVREATRLGTGSWMER